MTHARPDLPDDRVPAAAITRLLTAVEHVGIDLAELLSASATGGDYEQIVSGRLDTMSRAAHSALYREAMVRIEALADRASGRAPVTADDYALMWQSAITCRTLDAVIRRISAFSTLLDGRMGAIACERDGETARFRLDPMRRRRNAASFVAEMIGITMFCRMFSWLIGEEIPIREIVFDYGEDFALLLDLDLHDRPVRLGGKAIFFEFPVEYLDQAVIRSAGELDALLPLSLVTVSPQPKAGPFTRRVLHLMDEAVSSNAEVPDMASLSRALRCSPASLRRWLGREGTSLRAIKRERRHEWAIELLRRPGSSIADVSVRLGFSDETAFRRAFKAWSGSPPSAQQTTPTKRQALARPFEDGRV